MAAFRRFSPAAPLPAYPERFGIRSSAQVARDLRAVALGILGRDRFGIDLRSAGLLRPDLALPAYAGFVPADGLAPIFNFFDRTGGGRTFRSAASRRHQRDYRDGRLSYDEHDGVDFVCPPGTPLACAAPGELLCYRDDWLRGGLTACVDHGDGVVTQYTHLSARVAEPGQPLARGETVALSGTSGFDMTQFFPWVPPHVHFMVWVDGRPTDPYLAAGEANRAGTWLERNEPTPAAAPLPGDGPPHESRRRVLSGVIPRLHALCRSPAVRAELEQACSDAARVAILEDSRHHEPWHWPDEARGLLLRPPADPARVRLSLPLPADRYRGARPADTPWTRPPAA